MVFRDAQLRSWSRFVLMKIKSLPVHMANSNRPKANKNL